MSTDIYCITGYVLSDFLSLSYSQKYSLLNIMEKKDYMEALGSARHGLYIFLLSQSIKEVTESLKWE